MGSMLKIGACTLALAFAASAPALAQDDASKTTTTKHHAHHAMMHKGKHSKMGKMGMSEGDSATAKLNAQSLQQAKSGEAPASSGGAMGGGSMGTGSMSSGKMGTGSMAPSSTGSMAPPPSSTPK